MRVVAHVLAFLMVFCAGCERHVSTQTRTLSEGASFSDQGRQRQFTEALLKADIPFRTLQKDGKEFVEWDAQYSPQVYRIRDSIFVPYGRSIRFDPDRQSNFKEWLARNRIPYRTMVDEDGEYVVWEEEDAERVRSWEGFPSYYDDPPIAPRK